MVEVLGHGTHIQQIKKGQGVLKEMMPLFAGSQQISRPNRMDTNPKPFEAVLAMLKNMCTPCSAPRMAN